MQQRKKATAMPVELDRIKAVRLRNYFAEQQKVVLGLARRLVEKESPSGDEAGSRAVGDVVTEFAWLIEGVTSVERIAAEAKYGEHVRVRFFNAASRNDGGDAGSTLLLGHTDTVHPRGSLASRPWREDQNRIYAPGIFDMKANCALALEAIRSLTQFDLVPSREVVLLLTCDEESGSNHGGRELVEEEARRAAQVLVLEPSAPGGRVKTSRKGTAVYRIEAHGQAAHAGLDPEKGASAVHELARQIARLPELADISMGTTINVGVICGGTAANVVADKAHAEVDVRFTTMDEARRIEATLFKPQAFDDRVRLEVSGGINRHPLQRTAAVQELYMQARQIAAYLDFELGEASVGGASDGNLAAAMGVPVLDGLGIEGGGAHAPHEHILTSDIATRGALVAGLIASL